MANFLGLGVGLSVMVISLVVLVNMIAGLYPSVVSSLGTLNETGYNASGHDIGYQIEFQTLISPYGIIPLVVMAIVVIGIVVGLFTFLKNAKGR